MRISYWRSDGCSSDLAGRPERLPTQKQLRPDESSRDNRPNLVRAVPMTRALVAESLVTMRELLVEILRADPEIQLVGEAQNGSQALQMVKRLKPSVLVMGIGAKIGRAHV